MEFDHRLESFSQLFFGVEIEVQYSASHDGLPLQTMGIVFFPRILRYTLERYYIRYGFKYYRSLASSLAWVPRDLSYRDRLKIAPTSSQYSFIHQGQEEREMAQASKLQNEPEHGERRLFRIQDSGATTSWASPEEAHLRFPP